MNFPIPITNKTMSLADCRGDWTFDEAYQVWCLEDILYTPCAKVPKFQRLSIFVPKPYMNPDGTVNESGAMGAFTAKTAPVVFENNSAGYMQMPHVWLGGPRCYAEPYLAKGMVYVSAGCRGRESEAEGEFVGKSPISLVDLKTAIRFLRHNSASLPGDFAKMISIGWSAGGAMSSLICLTGDNDNFTPYLQENGAFMEESDAVYAGQIYCPIVDLEHADMSYEWMYHADKESENSPAGPAEVMTPYKEALSKALYNQYIPYFNSLGLKHPQTGEALVLGEDGRSGSGYDYLMACLSAAATKFLRRVPQDKPYTVEDYLSGNYEEIVHMMEDDPDAPKPPLPPMPDGRPMKPPTLGEMMCRPPKGVILPGPKFRDVHVPGRDKRSWLSWDGERATVSDLDAYVLNHRGRMKSCTSFDQLTNTSGENQVFGDENQDYLHFSAAVRQAIEAVAPQFPAEAGRDLAAYAQVEEPRLKRRVYLINPWNFIGTAEKSRQAKHYRIRVGASDADTAAIVSMSLAVKLANANCGTVDYALVWDRPHCEADYPGEVTDWITSICK